MKFFIYSRKSIYTGKGESIENQIALCKQYICNKFPDVADADIAIYEDEGFSAKNTNRPQFQQMLRDIDFKIPDFIVCYRLDRISRSVSDFSALIEDLNNRNISFVCIKEEFDTSKPMGKAMMYIASVFAQLERETIAERVRDNMLMLARTGRWLGGTTPTGYTCEKQREFILDGKVRTSCKLKDNPHELCVVDAIFEKFLELHSLSGVSKHLLLQGIQSRAGTPYSLLGIKHILQNPVYCIADQDAFAYFAAKNADVCFTEKDCSNRYGLLAYNKRDYKKKHAPRQPVDRWIIAIGKHPGRIPGKRWVAVQNILSNHTPEKAPVRMHNDYSLLSGLIRCGKCGSRMFAKQRSGKSTNARYDYICSRKLRGGRQLCDCQNLGGRQTDGMVGECLIQYADESSRIYKLLMQLKCSIQRQKDPLCHIEAGIKKCSGEIGNLLCTLSQPDLSPAFLQHASARIAGLDQERSRLIRAREHLQKSTDSSADVEIQIAALSNLKSSYPALSVYEKRVLIQLLVKKIIWDGTDLHLFMDCQ